MRGAGLSDQAVQVKALRGRRSVEPWPFPFLLPSHDTVLVLYSIARSSIWKRHEHVPTARRGESTSTHASRRVALTGLMHAMPPVRRTRWKERTPRVGGLPVFSFFLRSPPFVVVLVGVAVLNLRPSVAAGHKGNKVTACVDPVLCGPETPYDGRAVPPVSLVPIPTPLPSAFADDFGDVLVGVDELALRGERVTTTRQFKWCATEGEGQPSCFCNGVMRYGGYPGEEYLASRPKVSQWEYRRSCGNVDCHRRHFMGEDPLPGSDVTRICQCAEAVTPAPKLNALKWKWCSNEGGRCTCGARSVVRFGATGSKDLYQGGTHPNFFNENPQVMRWNYKETPETEEVHLTCGNEYFDGKPHPWPEEARESGMTFICQCAPFEDAPPVEGRCEAVPTPTPEPLMESEETAETGKESHGDEDDLKPWDVKWTWCANEGDPCMCLGMVRYGHSGQFEMYKNGSQFFKEHQEVFRWVNMESSGDVICNKENFADLDPFPNHKKLCQCAHGVSIDMFIPYKVPEGTDSEGKVAGKGRPHSSPQVILENPLAHDALRGHRVYHHKMHHADKRAAQAVAGLTEAELKDLRRENEMAAMKAATAAIAAREGDLPLLPSERMDAHALDTGGPELKEAALGAREPQHSLPSYIEHRASLGAALAPLDKGWGVLWGVGCVVVVAIAAVAALMFGRKRDQATQVVMRPLLGELRRP